MLRDATEPSIVQMNTVEGRNGGKVFLTLLCLGCSFKPIFLLERKTQDEVIRIFDQLTELLGIDLFHRLYPVILTDAGSEFQAPAVIEHTQDGLKRTRFTTVILTVLDKKAQLKKIMDTSDTFCPKELSLTFWISRKQSFCPIILKMKQGIV